MKTLTLGVEHRQQQGLSPRLQRAVRLLQLSSQEFAQEVYDVVGKNPFLETEENDGDVSVDGAMPAKAGSADIPLSSEPAGEVVQFSEVSGADSSDADNVTNAESETDSEIDRESWQADDSPGTRRNDDNGINLMDMHALEESLSDHLLRQLCVLPLSPRDLLIAQSIVGCLDEDGYLRLPLSELTDITGLNPPASEEELHIALSQVQALDPAGVAARNMQECLLLQLSAIERPEKRKLARAAIEKHLKLLAAKDMAGLARALSCSVSDVQAVLECIRRLDPRPGGRFGSSHIQYVTPDVIVRKVRGAWTASLNPAIVPKVRLNHVYVEMFQRNRKAQHGELAANLHEARWTVNNIEQRFATILSIAQAIVSRQKHFLEYGPLAMKPLGLREIADEVGVHESTVSRVTNNKFMATPLGVFEFKYFFSRAMTTASGGECSATAIRGLINELITAERPSEPLSDAEVARQLARQGIVVARRTVTKYRQSLRIESFERRRKLA